MNKSPKLTRELAVEVCDLDDPRLSRQNRTTLFLKFFSFYKNKQQQQQQQQQKNTLKTFKNLFVFESTKIEHVKTHFNKYNHKNEYSIH